MRLQPPGLQADAAASVDPAAVAEELVRRRELQQVLSALDVSGVPALVFKGAALALTHYPVPSARPRLDADLLVAPRDRDRAVETLESLGYRHPLRIPGELTRSQALYERADEFGVAHAIDLHWRISKPQVFAHLFPFDELAECAVPLPALGRAARTPAPVHALAIACLHRVAHHFGQDREQPIWLCDIHLIAERFDAGEASRFVALAERKRLAAVCAQGVGLAKARFGTALPAGLLESLQAAAARDPGEPSARYLEAGLRKVDVLVSDLTALPTWGARVRLVREHVLPPAPYMRETYGAVAPVLLPALYAWRVLHGVASWFRRRVR